MGYEFTNEKVADVDVRSSVNSFAEDQPAIFWTIIGLFSTLVILHVIKKALKSDFL